MTTSFKHLPVAMPSNHGVGLQDPANTEVDSVSISNFELGDSDDDVLTPMASSIPAYQFAPAAAAGSLASGGASAAAGIPGVGGDPPLKVATSGSGLVFLDTFTTDDTLAYENCVVAAEKQLEGIFTNNVTLRMVFNMTNVQGGDTDGNHFSNGVVCSYAKLKAALLKLAPDDVLPATDPSGGKGFTLAPAYARMLGLSTNTPAIDATVTFDSFSSPSDPWDFGQDVVNAVTHGISEAGLGRVSGLGVSSDDDNWEPLDFFRYTGPGGYDPTYDSKTTYFSSDGGQQTSASAGLSFNDDEIDGDPEDWRQQAVFGSNSPGETNTLVPTELDVMSALGWTVNLKQQVFTASAGNWENTSNWANGYNPIAAEDVALGNRDAAAVTLNADVTVNSISLNAVSSLLIDGGALVANDGTTINPADTSVVYSGNVGTITVADDGLLTIGDYFNNAAWLNIGQGTGGALALDGDVTLYGKGSVALGGIEGLGDIKEATSGAGLVNVDDAISGRGEISLASLDNQVGGRIESGLAAALGASSNDLEIIVSTFTNEGSIYANSNSVLEFGGPSGTGSLVNTGQVDIDSQGDLAINGAFSISGSGDIDLVGAGANITSNGAAASTLINKSTIESFTTQAQIGDPGFYASGANDLTLENYGAIVADGSGDDLVVNTGAKVIQDTGGLLEAENGAQMLIDSAVHTGSLGVLGGPNSGTIEAASGGVVTIGASVSDGIRSPEYSLPGQIVIDGGTVEFLSTGSSSVPIEFTGAGGVLEVHSAATALGAIEGLASGDALSLTGTSLTSVAIGSSSLAVVTNAGSFDFGNVSYDDAVTGYVAYADPAAAGMERVLLTDGNGPSLSETDKTIYQAASYTSVTGQGDTIDFEGAAANATLLLGTIGEADEINGSGGAIILDDAQAKVVGGSDRIAFRGPTGNQVSLYLTAGLGDTVIGANGIVYLDGAQANVNGAADTIHFESGFAGNEVSLLGAQDVWDTVEGSGGLASLNNTWAKVAGGGDTIDFASASGNQANLYDTASVWDTINGSNGTVFLNSSQAEIVGGGDTIDFSSGAGNIASLNDTGSAGDTVEGAAGSVDLHGVTASSTSDGDTFEFTGSNTLDIKGTAETMAFSHGIGGLDSITGVGSSDFFQFRRVDFADFAVLQAHMTQSGANTVISLNASDAVTLLGVTMSTLQSGQFKFT